MVSRISQCILELTRCLRVDGVQGRSLLHSLPEPHMEVNAGGGRTRRAGKLRDSRETPVIKCNAHSAPNCI